MGQGDDGKKLNTILFEGNINVSSEMFVQFKIPYQMVDGNLGKPNELGNITLSVNGILKHSGKHRFGELPDSELGQEELIWKKIAGLYQWFT